MSRQAIIRRPGEGKSVKLAGQPMDFLVTGNDTRHTSMFEWTIPPGFSTGLHVHRVQEETFYVLEGECDWQVGDERVRATPGSYLFLPPGVPHNIANASDTEEAQLVFCYIGVPNVEAAGNVWLTDMHERFVAEGAPAA